MFSVLITVYYTENPDYLDRALKSIWDDQTLKPNQIVLVKDGPLTKGLDMVINKWKNNISDTLDILPLKKNIGLGGALSKGINICRFDLIARMDTDDISTPDRFAKQVDFLNKNLHVDIFGSDVSEFSLNENILDGFRRVPKTHDRIIKISRKRNPFNHPSVMYRKKSVLKAGGPLNLTGFDDYYLWVRMINKGAKCANTSDILLKMRAGSGQMLRRGGVKYAFYELKFQRMLLNMKYISIVEFFLNLMIRTPIRILPPVIRVYVYKFMRSKS